MSITDSASSLIIEHLQRLEAEVTRLRGEVKSQALRSDSVTLTVEEAGVVLGCGRTKVFDLIRAKKLKRAKGEGRKSLVTSESVYRLAASGIQPEKRPSPPMVKEAKLVVHPQRGVPLTAAEIRAQAKKLRSA
jgi:excisionase family DNA binding protein